MTDGTQATLETRIGEYTVDERGERDEWNRGGVYGPDGRFDLGRTKAVLAERFAPVRANLPAVVGDYEQVSAEQTCVWYEWTTTDRETTPADRDDP